MCTLQRVINLLKNVNTSIRIYVLSLILTSGRKTCAEMARTVGISPKALYKFLSDAENNTEEIEKQLFDFAKSTRNKKIKRTLVVDPTAIIKRYAQLMEKLCHDKAGCTKNIEKCLVPVCASVVDQNIEIALCIDFWIQEKIIGKKKYKSKVKISQEIILYLIDKGVEFDFVSLDGIYPFFEMFEFLRKNKLKFIMRIATNRCVVTHDGKRAQLKNVPSLKLMRNSREKTIKAKLYDKAYFFTAYKRRKRTGGWETVFLVSNMNLSAKKQVASFNLRWPQEKINRTTKQKFGINQCQVVHASKQKAHIMAGYLAHGIIEVAKNDKQSKQSHASVDEIVNDLRTYHFDDLVSLIRKPTKTESKVKLDPVANPFQNHVQNFHNNVGESNVLHV